MSIWADFRLEIDTPASGWLDVTGPSTSLRVPRQTAQPGTIAAEVLDASLDPTQTDQVKMGKAARLSVRDAAGTGWVPIYTGALDDVQVARSPLARPGKTVKVTFSAVDRVSDLANTPERRGVASIEDLRWLIDPSVVPFVINGATTATAAGDVIAGNDNATLWDQVLITRDTNLGYVWVDGANRLQAWDAATIDDTPSATIGPDVYSSLDTDFALEQVVNSVSVVFRRYNIGTETSADVTYGPYEDAGSIAQWGRRSASYTIQAAVEDEAAIADYANAILARTADATLRPRSARVPIRDTADLALIRDVDLCSVVNVVLHDGVTVIPSRVAGIEHEVGTAGWVTTYTFEAPSSTATSLSTPGTGISVIPSGTVGTPELAADVVTVLDSADGKSRNYYAATPPADDGTFREGFTWFDISDGNRIHRWIEGVGWVAELLGTDAIADLAITNAKIGDATIQSAKIANLDAGKITTGALDAARIGANSIDAGKLSVGLGRNLVSNWSFEDPDDRASYPMDPTWCDYWQGAYGASAAHTGDWRIKVNTGAGGGGGFYPYREFSGKIPVVPDAQYRARYWSMRWNNASAIIGVSWWGCDASGALMTGQQDLGMNSTSTADPNAVWVMKEIVFTIPAGVFFVQPMVALRGGGGVEVWFIDDVELTAVPSEIRTKPGTGQRIVIRDDGNGGIIEAFSGVANEQLPTVVDPANDAGLPHLRIKSGTTTSATQQPSIDLRSNSAAAGGSYFALVADQGSLGDAGNTTSLSWNKALARFAVNGALLVSGKITSDGSYADTTTSTANAFWASDHHLARSTSLKKFKIKREPLTVEACRGLLDCTPTTWFDRGEWLRNGRKTDGLKRIPGLVAEDVEKHAPMFATYDDDGLSGVAYDRVGAALIPLVKELFARVAALEAQVEALTPTK